MPDEPNIIHLIARCGYLLMSISASYAKAGAVFGFIGSVSLKACSEAFGAVKMIIINLRLRMMMRRIG